MEPPLPTPGPSAEAGDRAAADALFAALYGELHRMAQRELARRGAGVTLYDDTFTTITDLRAARILRADSSETKQVEAFMTYLFANGQGPDGLLYLLTDEANGALLRIDPAK